MNKTQENKEVKKNYEKTLSLDERYLALKDKLEVVINKTEKPNSFETGKSGNRFKLYFEDAEDLDNQIKQLKEKGLYKEEN